MEIEWDPDSDDSENFFSSLTPYKMGSGSCHRHHQHATQMKKYQRMNVIVKPLSISHYVRRYLVVCRRHWSVMKEVQYMKINVKPLLHCYLLLVVLIVCRAGHWPSVTVRILHCKPMLIDHRICCWQRKLHERCISKMIHYCRYTKSPATHSRRRPWWVILWMGYTLFFYKQQ